MKKIKSILIISILLFTMVGCSDWLDVNTDPNNPKDASMEYVFPVATLEVATYVGGYYNLLGGMWSQYYTQSNAANQYKYIDGYIVNASDFNGQWQEMYAGALGDLNYIKTKAEAVQNWSMYLMATTLEVYSWQVLVDLYDEIPYFEALKGKTGNFSPKYDKGPAIYADLLKKLDDALGKDLNAPSAVLTDIMKGQDQVFGGNINKWVQFANTLKLKLYLRQMYVNPSLSENGIKELFNAGANFLTDDAKLDIFINEKNKDNPFYSSDKRNLNVSTNLRASTTVWNYLTDKSDPRLGKYYEKAPGGSVGVPLPQGGFDIISTIMNPTTVAVFHLEPTAPVYFFTKAEINFMRAEIAAKGWSSDNAKSFYDEGVKAAFARLSLDGSSFVEAGGAYEFPSSSDFEVLQKAIIIQKWLSMVGIQGLESFLETNRTHYPEVSSVPAWTGSTSNGSLNTEYTGGAFTYSLSGASMGKKFPKRLVIPESERSYNQNVPADLKAKDITDKIWWDTK